MTTLLQAAVPTTDFYTYILPSCLGIMGVLLGSIVTALANSILKKKETRLRIIEKVFDKRLNAYEDALGLVKYMRTTGSTSSVDNERNLITYPGALANRDTFEAFKGHFYLVANSNSHWFDIELTRELYFVQDYISTLDMFLTGFQSSLIPEVGILIKQDFIDLATSLEKMTVRFFERDIYTVNLKIKKGHHKYKRALTEERLMSTLLLRNELAIKNIQTSSN